MRKEKPEQPDVAERLRRLGFTVLEEYGCLSGENELFYLRHYPGSNLIELGVRKDFNKWSDSTDFSFSVPKTDKRWEEVFTQATADALAGRYEYAQRKRRRSPPKERYINRSRR